MSRLRKGFALLVLVGASGCSDMHYIRKASASYTYRERIYDADCVPARSKEILDNCVKRQQALRLEKHDIEASLDAASLGPLPKEAKARLKEIAARK